MPRRDLVTGGAVLGLLLSAALLAPWLGGADPTTQYDAVEGANLPPGSKRFEVQTTDGRRMLALSAVARPDGLEIRTRSGTSFLREERLRPTKAGSLTRERRFLLGTDRFGRDLWTRLLYGSRVSLAVAFLAALLSSVVGVAVGSAAVLGGRGLDGVLMRLTDGFAAFPRLFLLLALTAILSAGPAVVIVVLACTGWMEVSRLVRSQLLALESSEMALAARASGAGKLRTLWRHLLPNALGPVVVATTLKIGDVLLLEAALSYLGLGIRPPMPSWGNMIRDGAPDIASAWWTSAFPGLAIVVTVVAFNLVGDALQGRRRSRASF